MLLLSMILLIIISAAIGTLALGFVGLACAIKSEWNPPEKPKKTPRVKPAL